MKNVLDRLTELAKDNPSPDVKQAMENTRRMSVVEDADVVEVHEGVAEGWKQTLRKFDPTIKARIRDKSQDQTNQGLDTIQHLADLDLTSDDMVSRAMKPNTYFKNAERYAKLANKGMEEGGKTPKQYWNRDSQSIGSTPDDGLTYADPDEDGVHYPDYGNTKFQPQAKPTQAKPTQSNKRLTDKQYATQLHKHYASLYDTLRITFNRRKNIFSVTGNNGFETDYHKYRVDPATNKLKIMMSTSVENESVNPGMAEGKTIASGLNDWQKKALKHDTYEKYVSHCNRYDYPHMDKRAWQRYKNAFDNMGTQGVTEDFATLRHYKAFGVDLVERIASMSGVEVQPDDDAMTSATITIDVQGNPNEAKQLADMAKQGKIKPVGGPTTRDMAGKARRTGTKYITPPAVVEGVNFAEMHRTKHTTLDEMLNELHDDINTFKQCGQMSEQLRDFMEVHHYGKKQLMDAAYGPVDELADMTKLAGVPGPIGQPDEELAESSGEMINGKEVDMYSLEVGGVDYQDSPDFVDAYFEAGSFVDGTPLSDNELEQLTHERGDLVSELASEHMIGAGDDARDRQRDMDMELEGVNDGDNGLASAHAKARQISGEHGVGQHVNRDPESGHHHCSDWYVDGETVGSYNMGKRYDDSGYIDEEEMMPGEESDVAQKAQGIEAVSGKKINQMNPGEIKMAGQKVDAMGVTESKQMVDECGMMGGSMQPNTPANINISASAASGGEVAAMINDLLKLAGRPENADAHMDEPGVVAIDGTMDAGGAEELAAMLGGEEVVDETGDAGGFADATTQPDALVYDQNPVLTQTGVQKHTLGGYHNGDSPLAATTELEESLWRKFQNQ